jgi:hypothetical protein
MIPLLINEKVPSPFLPRIRYSVKKNGSDEITSNMYTRAPTTFKLEGEVTCLSESSQGEVGDNREKWGDF